MLHAITLSVSTRRMDNNKNVIWIKRKRVILGKRTIFKIASASPFAIPITITVSSDGR